MADTTITWPADPALRVTGGFTSTPFLYICDSGNNRIVVTDYEGNPLFEFGTFGSGNGQFNSPYGVTNDGVRVYVTDTGNHRVQYFDLLGNYLGQWGSRGTGVGELDTPMGIAADGSCVYVVENGNNRFQIFTKTGESIFMLGEYGDGSGTDQFNGPTNCYVDEFFLWIDDTGNNRIVGYLLTQYGDYISAEMPGMESEIDILRIMYGPLDAEMPGMESEITLLGTIICDIDVEMPYMESEITLLGMLTCDIDAELPEITAEITAIITALIEIDAVMPGISAEIVVFGSIVADIDSEMPGMEAYIVAEITGIISEITGLSENVVTVVINTLNKAVTEFTGFDFNSYSFFHGKYIGALNGSDAGIYELAGDADDQTPIDAAIQTGDVDLYAATEQEGMKTRRISDLHVNRKAEENITLLLHGDQDNNKTRLFEILGSGDSLPHTKRVKPGKGIKWRIVSLEIQNKNGSDFELEQMVLDAEPIGKDAYPYG